MSRILSLFALIVTTTHAFSTVTRPSDHASSCSHRRRRQDDAIPATTMMQPSIPHRMLHASQCNSRRGTALRSILDDVARSSNDDDDDVEKFNPLSYNKAQTVSGIGYTGNQISLRKMRMQGMVDELLDAVGDDEKMEEILREQKEFLLAPLEDGETILDPDSIYTPEMSRSERYATYQLSMDKRIAAARNARVKQVLESMREFVVRCE